jgi:hypothetical protein
MIFLAVDKSSKQDATNRTQCGKRTQNNCVNCVDIIFATAFSEKMQLNRKVTQCRCQRDEGIPGYKLRYTVLYSSTQYVLPCELESLRHCGRPFLHHLHLNSCQYIDPYYNMNDKNTNDSNTSDNKMKSLCSFNCASMVPSHPASRTIPLAPAAIQCQPTNFRLCPCVWPPQLRCHAIRSQRHGVTCP